MAVLAAFDVSPMQALLFGTYVVLGIALPGTLLLRLLRGYPAHIAEDLALGLALGYCILTAAYVVARAAGVPELHILWAVATIAAITAIPGLRRHWRAGTERAPLAWTWSICAILIVLVVQSTGEFARQRLTGVDMPYVDMPYQLALIGELRHHVPPQVPYVAGEPLLYHWFFYAQAAATSWATGLEPVVLLYRLSVLPVLAGFVVLTAVAAQRVTKRWWPGPVAATLALLATVASLYHWLGPHLADSPAVFDTQPLSVAWISPTHMLGLLLFGAALLVLMDRLGPPPDPLRREWLLAGLLVLGASGAKASALPLLLAGLVTVIGVAAIRSRSLDRNAAWAALLVIAGIAFAVVFVFGGSTGGLEFGLDSLRQFPVASSVGAPRAGGLSAIAVPAVALGIALVLWAVQGSAALAVLRGRGHARGDARLWLLLGAAAGGMGAAALLDYPGLSQWYYLRGTAGVVGILAAWGIARLVGPLAGWRLPAGVIGAVVAGTAVAIVIRALGPTAAPRLSEDGLAVVAMQLTAPVIALLVCLGIGLLVIRWVAPRAGVPVGILAVALAMGAALPPAIELVARPVLAPPRHGVAIPPDGVEAARWLRDHSRPDDLVAANLHCRTGVVGDRCDARHFWVSAATERRMLVEGWAYTAQAYRSRTVRGATSTSPFWDPERLAVNDAAFTSPAAGVPELASEYGVRWLFADLAAADEQGLRQAATERFRSGRYAVYEVPATR